MSSPVDGCSTKTTNPPEISRSSDQAADQRKLGSKGGRLPMFNTEAYKRRHAAESGINQLMQQPGVTTRFDELAVRDEVTIYVAAINTWLRSPRPHRRLDSSGLTAMPGR